MLLGRCRGEGDGRPDIVLAEHRELGEDLVWRSAVGEALDLERPRRALELARTKLDALTGAAEAAR